MSPVSRPTVNPQLGLPLGGCQAKWHNQVKEEEKEGFIAASNNTGDLSQSSISLRAKLEKF